jgi:hypothetical protein
VDYLATNGAALNTTLRLKIGCTNFRDNLKKGIIKCKKYVNLIKHIKLKCIKKIVA